GNIYEGRGWDRQGAHCPGHNVSGLSVQIAVGGDQEPTPAALAAARALYDEACRKTGRGLAKRGHKDGIATLCPGARLYAWVQAGMPAPTAPPAGGSSGGTAPTGSTYTIRPGDTLSAIATAHGTTVSELARLNGIADPNRITAGTELKVPGKSSTPAAPSKPKPYAPPKFPAGLTPNRATPSARTLQRALKAAGFLAKTVAEADNYGPQTQTAVGKFHNAHPQYRSQGVSYDPAIGPKGWAALFTLAYGK
ncbi:LysM peptidoglycan-binding domain-containing protein, partial [Streptomyces sp. NPDC000994]